MDPELTASVPPDTAQAHVDNSCRATAPPTADFVVVANRLPVDLQLSSSGEQQWTRSPGGLVTAMECLLSSRSGAWVGWPGLADFDADPTVVDGIAISPVSLSSDEVEDYYEGFSNATLWPLFHNAVVQPEYHRHWWQSYQHVNHKFAEAVSRVASPGAVVWVQDYQLLLVPALLRELRPDLTIGFFLHIPLPPAELFAQLPWRTEIISGMLGADLVGFQLLEGADNFINLCRRFARVEASYAQRHSENSFKPGVVYHGTRDVKVSAFPISIESADLSAKAQRPPVRTRASELREELGNPACLMLGVDRLDYTKGIDVRIKALEELLDDGKIQPGDVLLLQIATPSRERVDQYVEMRNSIEQSVGRINGKYGLFSRPVVNYIHRGVPRQDLIAFYSAADIMLVTPMRDGMNLVAKEFIACNPDHQGALVLSEFCGAAMELSEAYQCNPYDIDGVKRSILAAITDTAEEKTRRMARMHHTVLTNDVEHWASSFFDELQG